MTNIIRGDCPTDFLEWRQGSGKTIEIFDLHVSSERRRQGIARGLVNKLLDLVPSDTMVVWAFTRAENVIAQQFYEEMHFRVMAVVRGMYQDGPLANQVDSILYGRDVGRERENREETPAAP